MRVNEVINEAAKGGQRPGEETPIPMKPGFKPDPVSSDNAGNRENPFKKPYKPNRPTDLPPGVTIKEAPYGFGQDWNHGDKISSNPSEVLPEVPADFNPTVAYRKIHLLKQELGRMGYNPDSRAKIVAEIRKLENQISLYLAQKQSEPGYGRHEPSESDEGAPYTKYTKENGGTGQPFAKTREGAINGAKRDIMQQKSTDYLIVTDNNHEVVYSWSHYPREDLPKVGDTYQTQRLDNRWQASNQQRYPAGHPHAGAVMPPRV